MRAFHLWLAGAALLCLAVPSFADVSICDNTPGNIVANCGFEGGTYTDTGGIAVPNGWTANAGWDSEPNFNNVRTSPNSGSFNLSIGNDDFQAVPTLSQTLGDVAGETYSGSLFVEYTGCCGDPGAFFDVQVNNQNVLALDSSIPNAYNQYFFSFTGAGSDVLTLTGNTNPGEWYVDDVVVTSNGVVTPEPNLIFVLAGALSAVVLWRVRRSCQVS